MIVQRVQVGTQVEQFFVDKARLVIRESVGVRPTIILELDVTPTDPRYKKVEVELRGLVRFVKKEKEDE